MQFLKRVPISDGASFPLSGNVLQDFNPFALMLGSIGQIGFINVSLGQTPNPKLEEQILDDVGSYGRQIGRLADALDVLIGTLDLNQLSEAQLTAIHAFKAQLAEVRKIKAKAGPQDPNLSRPVPKLSAEAVRLGPPK